MSYRSFKRVLGETKLQQKCLYLFGTCLFVLITGSFFAYYYLTSQLVYRLSSEKAGLLVDPILLARHWEALGDDPNEIQDWKEAVPWLGSQMQQEDYTWSFLRPGPTDSSGEPQTTRDKEALERFRADPKLEFQEVFSNDYSTYVYYHPLRLERSCINCHLPKISASSVASVSDASSGEGIYGLLPAGRAASEGDLFSIVKIRLPNSYTQTDMNQNRAILITFAIITTFLAMVASYIIIRYVIVKPVTHLRDVSDAVSRGGLEARAEIRTADEFEELGEAFNRMLRHLVATQEELRQVNGDLDAKVDELAQLNMRLFEMNRLKSDFLATMSHELRTPLNSIIGFSDVLGSIKSLDEKQRRYVQNIQTSGKMLLDMINDILDLAKIESGKMAVRLTDFRIEHVINGLCDMARPLTEKKNIDLEIEIEPRLPSMHQDQGKVQQILNNLLSNAIKFTPEGGRIVVSAKQGPTDDLLLTVADTGVGIAEEDQARIFEKFRQGSSVLGSDAMTREYSGTGLGLSIVKELCKLLGGEISLTSELGKGSTFSVRLPWTAANPMRLDSDLAEELHDMTNLVTRSLGASALASRAPITSNS